jgi:dihydroflavonol-4-reductase
MKLLVTGGTGFIGSHLAEEGRRRGAEVVVLGLTDRPEERANTELLRRQGVEVLGGSITDEALCRRAVRGATHVFHLAVAMREGGKRDEFFETVNLEGTRRLLEACAAENVRRFVYCSTIGIFGHRVPGVTTEETPLAPGNIYERTKVSAEALVREVGAGRGLPYVILRPADVYGPRDQRLLKLFAGVSRGRFPLFGRGHGRRHMIYVDDVVAGFFKACERDEALHPPGADRRGAGGAGQPALRAPGAAPADADAGGSGGGRLPGAGTRPADLSPADGFLLE